MNDSAPLLEVRDVAKRFGAVIALKSATLNLVRGEIHALMGANGAGKSTLVKILTGVHPADAGTITINGATRVFRSPAEARRAGIVSVYQDPALVPDLTIGQNMRLADVPLAERAELLWRPWNRGPRSERAGARHSVSSFAPHRSGPCAGLQSDPAYPRRDHRRSPGKPGGTCLRGHAQLARARQFGDFHLSSHGGGRRALRSRHGFARWRNSRRRRHSPRKRRANRLAYARLRPNEG